MNDILSVNYDFLKSLNSTTSVEFFRDLIWAEVRRREISPSKVDISLRTNVPDGGIDACVDADIDLKAGGLIETGINAYQIKTGSEFKPHQKSVIKRELFGDKTPTHENLAHEIKDCFEKQGRYVIVCFGLDLIGDERKKAKKHLEDFFTSCGYPDARFDVWGIVNLSGFIQDFPALILRTNQLYAQPIKTHYEWSHQEDMRVTFEMGQEQQNILNDIRGQLRDNNAAGHIRILGEAGVGKTRFILQAIDVDDLRPLVIYIPAASLFDNSSLMAEVTRNEHWNAIIVIDECDPDQRARIWNNLKWLSPKIKLISIFNENETISGIPVYVLPGLSDEHISAIIQSYGTPKLDAGRWVQECGGSPRVAHVVGLNLQQNPDDIFRSPSHVNIWDRFICGADNRDSASVRQRRIVLQHIALFKKFGYQYQLADEARAIQALIQMVDPQITLGCFREIIDQLKKRRILQGEVTLYITPRLLHTRLWIDWWNNYGDDFDIGTVINLPPRLREWFFEMLEYAEGSPSAAKIVKELLGPDGLFWQDKGELLKTDVGMRFFFHLAQADPKNALICLENTIGKWSKAELLNFERNRSSLNYLLEIIAQWDELFPGAARLLLALGEAENQTYSNNASGIWADLFSFSTHKEISKTETPPQRRIPLIVEALKSTSPERRLLGIKACERALTWFNSVTVEDKIKIVGKKPDFWFPKTYGELFDAYKRVWKLLYDELDMFTGDELRKAIDVLLNAIQFLGTIESLNEMILEDLIALEKRNDVNQDALLATVLRFVHNHEAQISPEILHRWRDFQIRLTKNELHSQLVRYLDLNLVDWAESSDDPKQAIHSRKVKLIELADYCLANPIEFQMELEWLMSNDFYQIRELTYQIGDRDQGYSLLTTIVEKVRTLDKSRTAAAFLGSYLRSMYVKNNRNWMQFVFSLSEIDELVYAVPLIIWQAGELSDESIDLLFRLIRNGKMDIHDVSLFSHGDYFYIASQEKIEAWFELLFAQNDIHYTFILLSIFEQIYANQKKALPEHLTLKVLTHPTLVTPSKDAQFGPGKSYSWEQLADRFIQQWPEQAIKISGFMLEHFGDNATIFGAIHSPTHKVLEKISSMYPQEVWRQITTYLDLHDYRAYSLSHWLHGDSGFFGEDDTRSPVLIFHPELIWQWVDENIEGRARYLATFVPRKLHRKDDEICLARELLVRYGENEKVRRNLISNFTSGGWTGDASQFYLRKKKTALEFQVGEANSNVMMWLNEYIDMLEKNIQQEKIQEERDNF